MATVDVTRTYLELAPPHAVRRARTPAPRPALEERRPISAEEYLALYTLVGDRWHWHDRLAWPPGVLQSHLDAPGVHVWVATLHDDVVGYFELMEIPGGGVEIKYFGLAPAWIGRGLGGWLLTRAVEIAADVGAERVVLDTCTLDGPHALANYLARGFIVVRDEVYRVELKNE